MDSIDILLSEFDEQEMSEVLEGVYVQGDPELNKRILTKLGLPTEKHSKVKTRPEVNKKKRISLKKIIPVAASLAVIVAVVSLMLSADTLPKTTTTAVTTTAPTTTQPPTIEQGILFALITGDDSLLKSVIESSGEKAQAILNEALNGLGVIPYETVRNIAKATYDTFGATGLDPLLESTILADNERAIAELRKREQLLMSSTEKSAFFFAAAFCNSEVLNEFIAKGYDVTIKDSVGNTVYEIAKINSNEEIMEYLKGVN